ncbi:MAG: zinc-dependent alcohol dehydrogenase [Candidatus Hadarchaeia archaeon]
MKAARIYGKKDMRVEDVDKPEINDSEVLIKTKACGICGTDAAMYMGEYLSKTPVIPGHEFAGEVVEVGDDVESVDIGDRVMPDENVSCGTCYWCKRQQKLFCPSLYQIGIGEDGGFAEYFKAPGRNVHHLPSDLSYEEATLAEPLACATSCVDRGEVVSSDVVTVLGDGPLGVFCAKAAQLEGASKVILSGHHDYRLELGKTLGADITVNSNEEDLEEVVNNVTDGRGADVVIEAVGHASTYEKAVDLVRRGGNVSVMGVPPQGETVELDAFDDIFNKELTFHVSFAGTYDTWLRALTLIDSGKVEVEPLITHRTSIDDLEKAVKMVRDKDDEAFKIIASPEFDGLERL